MKKFLEKNLFLAVILVLIGQLIFAFMSPTYTMPSYAGHIYATTGVKHKQEDLHKLNKAAHYFGQTMIGWLKFPNFLNHLKEQVTLPEGAGISAHIQERQNIIFTVSAPTPLEIDTLKQVKDHLQSKINEYNAVSQTEFVLTNLDYETVENQRSYLSGALITLLVTLVIASGYFFIRKEFK